MNLKTNKGQTEYSRARSALKDIWHWLVITAVVLAITWFTYSMKSGQESYYEPAYSSE